LLSHRVIPHRVDRRGDEEDDEDYDEDDEDEDDDDDDDDDDDEDNRIQVPIMAIPETYLLMIPEFLVRICIALNVLLLIADVSR
jgi:hypothetical protein